MPHNFRTAMMLSKRPVVVMFVLLFASWMVLLVASWLDQRLDRLATMLKMSLYPRPAFVWPLLLVFEAALSVIVISFRNKPLLSSFLVGISLGFWSCFLLLVLISGMQINGDIWSSRH